MSDYIKNYILNNWQNNESKVFRYKRPFVPDEYICIKKVLEQEPYPSTAYVPCFKPDIDNSTYNIKAMSEAEMKKMVSTSSLIYLKDHTVYTNVKEMKTGLCTCGAWALLENTYKHSEYCLNYKKVMNPEGSND